MHTRVVNGPTSSGPNPARTRKCKPKPETNLKPKSCPKNPKVKLGLKNLPMLPSYFDYIFVHLKQKVRLRLELSPTFLSTLSPNSARTRSKTNSKSPVRLTTLMHTAIQSLLCTEVESSRTSLVLRTSSRTHFQVLGLGLFSLRSSKIALSSARGQHYFWTVEILLENARNLAETLQITFLFSAIGA